VSRPTYKIDNHSPAHHSRLDLELSSHPSCSLLQLIANECYKLGQFLYAAKAFDVLERLDPNPEYWEGKRGACIGLFQAVIAGREDKDLLREIISMLRNTSNPQVSAPRLGFVLQFAAQK
jgi:intraflagellar transport protein 56